MSLKVALIGAGYFASFHAQAWHDLDGTELAGVCDLNPDAAAQLAGNAPIFVNAEAMIEEVKPDLIDIATPPQTHLAMTGLAIAHQIPAICQKPIAPTYDEALEIARMAQDAGHKLIIHENIRFQPWYREVKRLMGQGVIGTPYGISFRLRPGDGQGADAYLARQPYFQKMERFLIHETGIHWIDTFRYLLGEISSVYADLRRLNPVISGEDAGIVHFEFASGARGIFDGNRLARHPAKNPRLTMGEMWLEGSDATLRLDGDGRLWRQDHDGHETEHVYQWRDRGFGGGCVANLQAHVSSHFNRGTPLENEISAYMRNLEVQEAVYRSAREHVKTEMTRKES